MRYLTLLLCACLALISAPASASAATPIQGTFDNGYESFVDPDVCAQAPYGFDIYATQHEYGRYQLFFDSDGDLIRIQVFWNYDAWISANGKTIVERDTATQSYYPDGSRTAGLTVHIQGPGGTVQLDAGQIVWDNDWNVLAIHGPHPQFLAQTTFCGALTP
jgi:hypothetical protein